MIFNDLRASGLPRVLQPLDIQQLTRSADKNLFRFSVYNMSYLLIYELASIFDLILIVELIWLNIIRQRYLKIKIQKTKKKKKFYNKQKKSAGLLHPTDSITPMITTLNFL